MIEINHEQNITGVTEGSLDQIIQIYNYLLLKEGIFDQAETSLTFVDNEKIRELNKEYRNKDEATDVLSFSMYSKEELLAKSSKPENDTLLLGDIVISLEKTLEQAEEYEHSFERELFYLFVHGMLHLFGYDHLKEDDKNEMRVREEAILEHFGITR